MIRISIRNIAWLMLLAYAVTGSAAGQKAQKADNQLSADEKANIQAYIDLIRTDVRDQKKQILAVMMDFSAEDAAAFWPIYKNYDAELTKLGDRKLAIIKDYGEHYDSLTDAKANELIQKSFEVVAERNMLLKKCYEQVKEKLGAKDAARFVQIENQMLMIIDLQVAAQLPAVK